MKEKQLTLIAALIIDFANDGATRTQIEHLVKYSQAVMDLYKEEESK